MGQALEIIFQVCGGLGIFLLGMKNMSEGMQAVAGERLRKMIGAVTNNRLMAGGVGTLVTCIIQSSSVTTVMVVGMVNASIMTLTQAIGVILGANIGTTITGWILVIRVGKYGLPLLGIAAFFYLFSKKDVIRFFAMFLVGLGMVFFGLELMKNGFAPIRDMPGFIEWFHRFRPDTYLGVWKCVLVGAALTAIVQSSSATLGITMALALTGTIDYLTAAALILGENIGTTITAFLASLGAFTNARRAAYAHVLFNVIGVFWITLLFTPYTNLVSGLITRTQMCDMPPVLVTDQADNGTVSDYAHRCDILAENVYVVNAAGQYVNTKGDVLDENTPHVMAADFMQAVEKGQLTDLPIYTTTGPTYPFTSPAIAFTHTGFNVVNTLMFLPFIGFLARFLVWLVPERVAEKPRLTYLNVRMLDTPAIAIEQTYKELIKMGQAIKEMMRLLKPMVSNKEPDRQASEELFQKENDLDVIQKEIVEFIGDMMAGNITHEVMQDASSHLRMADELESISDYIQSLLKLRLKMRNTDLQFSEGGLKDMILLHEKVEDYIDLINKGIEQEVNTQDYFSEMRTKGLAVTKLMKECRGRHLARVGESVVSPLMSLIYTDMLTAYRRIKDHAFNIAEVLAGEK